MFIFSHSVQFSSFRQLCPTLCDPMNCSTPGLPSPTPIVYPNLCPLSRWCHPTISSSVVPFSSHLQFFPSIRVFPNELHQVAKVLEFQLQHQDWSLGWTGWISFQSKGLSKVQQHSSKASVLQRTAFFIVQLSHPYMTSGKTIALTRWTLCWQSNVSAF